ncbi:hypothetical protein H0194_02525 [Corynebacterium incognita]|uniref:Glycosyl transferase family 28 C-terminal domain-containing protein n=1 Tax=Corynebacterium incognita TaxID=2754725 RepID=A0A7G7CQR4_9CORY|nr:glycosyltransferase [Corynebacterium incognita]QNE89930.1 hypothetical protein H0194_02525 [Corynebacterium incognita]
MIEQLETSSGRGRGPVGMYAHHHGSGHLNRCRAIARYLDDTVIFSSAAGADITLPLDVAPVADNGSDEQYVDETAGGTLHWAPLQVKGLRDRLARIAEWVAAEHPRVFYVDASVEVAAFVRLLGVPVVSIAMPGERDDAAHQLAYAQAAALVAAWPEAVPIPAHLRPHEQRLNCVGGISSFEPHCSATPQRGNHAPGTHGPIVVLYGRGGSELLERCAETLRQAVPAEDVVVLGGENAVADPLRYMAGARAVVCAAGQNSVADVALAGIPAIVVPQSRPFGEQEATARVLEDCGLATVLRSAPTPAQWDEILAGVNPAPSWEQWCVPGAARRAAEVIEKAALS